MTSFCNDNCFLVTCNVRAANSTATTPKMPETAATIKDANSLSVVIAAPHLDSIQHNVS